MMPTIILTDGCRSENVNVRVDKRDGRGRVFIVQQPNRRNNFTTIVQIVDSKGGADSYRFTLHWN